MSFAAQLSTHRKRLGLTQAEAAFLLGVGLRTYAGWERDDDPKRRPHLLTQEGALARLRDADKWDVEMIRDQIRLGATEFLRRLEGRPKTKRARNAST